MTAISQPDLTMCSPIICVSDLLWLGPIFKVARPMPKHPAAVEIYPKSLLSRIIFLRNKSIVVNKTGLFVRGSLLFAFTKSSPLQGCQHPPGCKHRL
jgi:hypothetical protein